MTVTHVDTLVTDSAVIARWRNDGTYDYDRELVQADFSFWEWLNTEIGRFLSKLDWLLSPSNDNWYLWFAVGAVIVLGLAAYVLVKHPTVFGRRAKASALSYEEIEDNIYEVDFEQLIARAEERGDHKGVVRLVYLHTLRLLSDAGRIAWKKYKAPMQYVRELNVPEFKAMTLLFLQVRYGGYDCGQEQTDRMRHLQRMVCAGNPEEGGAV